DNIDQGATPEDITLEKQKAIDGIRDIVDQAKLQDKKKQAQTELEDKADDLKDKIDRLPGVSKKEKDKAKTAIDQIVKEGIKSIIDAKDLPAMLDALQTAKDRLDAIYHQIQTEFDETLGDITE